MASPAAVLVPLTTLFGMATEAAWTSRFGDGGAAAIPTTFGICREFSSAAIEVTLAESAAVSGAESAREKTIMAALAVT